jgi:hypothetical protein
VRDPSDPSSLANFLAALGDHVATRHEAVPAGKLINASIPESSVRTVLASEPFIFERSFAIFGGTLPPTEFVWLIPVHPAEAEFKREFGEHALRHLFDHTKPDFFDLSRGEIATTPDR